jgi:hypothetical protein
MRLVKPPGGFARLTFSALILSLCFWQAVKAQALAPIAVAAVKSVDAAASLVGDLGFPVPVSADMIEQQFPFIGKGNVATDQPIGIIFFGGPNAAPDKSMAFVIPVKPGAATVDSLLQNPGAKAFDGHPDTVLFGTTALRRTDTHLVFSPVADIPALVKVGMLTDALKGPDTLARVVVDLKSMRQNSPDLLKQFMDMSKANTAAPKGDAEREGQDMAMGWFQAGLDNLDRLEIGLDRGAFGVRVSIAAAPIKASAAIIGKRPSMPAGVIARLDLSGAAVATLGSESIRDTLTKSGIDGAEKERAKTGPPLTENQKRSFEDLFKQVFKLSLADDGVSIGVESLGNSPVVYVLERYSKPIDFLAALRQAIGKLNKISDDMKDPRPPLELKSYPLNDMTVVRLLVETSATDKTPVAVVDAVEKGNDVMIAISQKSFRTIDRLIDAQGAGGADASGESADALAAGWVDMGRAFDGLAASGALPASVPAERQAKARELLAGVRIETSTSVHNDSGTVEITLPANLIRNIPKLIGVFAGGGANAPAPEPSK